jgi:Skp family chaperone for outer membrane proteins
MSGRIRINKGVLAAVAALAVVSAITSMRSSAAVSVASPVAYVTPRRIFAETNEGKAGVARVQALQQQRQAELRTKQQVFEATRQQIAKATDQSVRLQLQQQELQQKTELERFALQSENDVLALRRQVESDMQAKVKKLLEEMAKAQNVAMVINEDNAIVWASPSLDFTDAVIERLNTKPSEKR